MNMTNPASLPPGFRFHPTDEELIIHYLKNRASSVPCPVSIIAEVDIYKFDPWELPDKALFGDREWYFFSPRDRKYPNGIRPNRAAASGYWKATGTDKPIHRSNGNENIGVKKALVFYKGRPPKGLKTNWIMHEYRLAEAQSSNTYRPMKFRETSMRLDDWVLCRIYKKSNQQSPQMTDNDQEESGSEEVYPANYPTEPQMNDQRLTKSFSLSEFLVDNYNPNMSNVYDNIPAMTALDQNQLLVHGGNSMAQHVMQGGPTLSVIGESSLKRQRDGDFFFEEGNGALLINPSKRLNDSCTEGSFGNLFDGVQQQPLVGQPVYGQQQIPFSSHFGKN
ncbi:hypothetical protein LUZ61_013820 [Rhynchospora tenuis]|uniref:NAC domain-containing protein n=1 Tax=Rhynchospora tenuis TaxID=198213 RepID=A0AAD5W9H0_9POAL|nr:hypothetical protein LUZ61_013820 [Rhynchospora tenuis]